MYHIARNQKIRSIGSIKTCIGILFNLENERIGAVFREAIWPRTKFIFMGYNNRDQQIRAYFFDGAKI